MDKGLLSSQESLESETLCLEVRSLRVPATWVESVAQRPVHLGVWSQCGTREKVLANHRPAKQLWICRSLGVLDGRKGGSHQQRDLREATLEILHALCLWPQHF